ncbi:hypothetical protein RJ641_023862 [Dillenia turbinata]|uniref:Ycf20-like protein n=1 Tax=Dillenia turbinata TaxID=194707 RepID=A0AAN8UD45_9MAGN
MAGLRVLIVMPSSVSKHKRSSFALVTCSTFQFWKNDPSSSGQPLKPRIKTAPFFNKRFQMKWQGWRISLALNTSGLPEDGGQEDVNNNGAGLGGTRLGRIVTESGRQLLQKLNSARKNFPMKIFLLLLGFYTANALATILGQTGDWDVLVAGVVVAVIEGIGMLMYRKAPPMSTGRLQSLVVMINYWKAGVILGLFVDAFKLGS